MKFTLSWLQDYVDISLSATELAAGLTMAGLEVDSVDETGADLDQLVIARVAAVEGHPDADRLHVCEVDDGEDRRQIVCGAANVHAGMITVLARPGAVLPGGLKIKSSKLRGVKSDGMLCSAAELGLEDGSDGILDLDRDLSVGTPAASALGLVDTLIEVDLTPNRADCASVIGIAREAAALTNTSLRSPAVSDLSFSGQAPFTVKIADYDLCRRYCACIIRGVKVGPSPWWLKKRLLSVGLRPINNVVDITNFVMLECGQPMHAFDFNRLSGTEIEVRSAREGEKIKTLDGREHDLTPETLVVADAGGAVAVAGVMGGEATQVDAATGDILLESACFSAVSVRRTARRLNLGTDSSYRFERGVDPGATAHALARAAELVVKMGAGEIEGAVDVQGKAAKPLKLLFRPHRCNKLLGTSLSGEEIMAMLSAIELGCRLIDTETLEVTVPTFRVDIEREIDLVEEVARLVGYDHLPESLPRVTLAPAIESPDRVFRLKAAAAMVEIGLSEVINYSFVSSSHRRLLGYGESPDEFVRLKNPLAEEQSVMRTTILPGLIENLNHNLNRQAPGLMIFEVGKVFHPRGGRDRQPRENTRISAIIAGRRNSGAPVIHFGREKVDLYDVTGVVSAFISRMGYRIDAFTVAEDLPFASGTVAVSVNGVRIGACGELSPGVTREFGVKQAAWFIDLDLDMLMGIKREDKIFFPLPKFPAVYRDIAIVLSEAVPVAELMASLEKGGGNLLESAELFDVYKGDKVEAGTKSVAVRLVFRSAGSTLKDKQINKAMNKILAEIARDLGGKLRES